MAELAGWRALVTGASSGIGEAVARELAARGADLVITARRGDRLEALAADLRQSCGVHVAVVALDLSVPGAGAALEQAALAGGPVDILVASAGIGRVRAFTALPWPEQRALLELDLVVLTELCHRFAARMVAARRGRILVIGSVLGAVPVPGYVTYAAAKAYVRSFGLALAAELRGTGVTVTCCSPGATVSEFHLDSGARRGRLARRFTMSAERCARVAVRALLRGRRHVVPGLGARIFLLGARLLPQRWLGARVARGVGAGADQG